MPALMMNKHWTQSIQAFVQERTDCDYEYIYDKSVAVLYGDLEVIKEFIELCELIDLMPNSEMVE